MAMVINTNIYSTIAQNSLTTANSALGKSIERLSTGLRINSASDDASGLAISEKLRGQIRGMAKASMNAQDAISYLQTAEGGMQVIGDMLQRMRELAVQAGNGTYTTNDRAELQKEVDQLKDEINRIASSTEYNTKKLLTGQSSALWSTSNPSDLEAIVRGATTSGNYNIDIEAIAGQNYIYKSDIMSVEGVTKTVDTYDYSFNYSGTARNGTFANVNGEIKNSFNVSVDFHTAVGTATTAIDSVYDIHTGTLANGEASNFNASFSSTAATISSYVVVEALTDGTLTDNVATSSQKSAFKVTVYDAKTGEKTEYNMTNVDLDAARTLTIAGVGTITFDPTTTQFAAGDKIVFSHSQEAIRSAANTASYQAGKGPLLGAAGTAADPLDFAVLEMDDSGNISIGRGSMTIDTSSSNVSSMTVKPTLTTKSVMEIDQKALVGTTVNASRSNVVGGLYPAGLDVTVRNSAGTTAPSAKIASEWLQDQNLRTTITGNGGSNTGHYIVEYIGAEGRFTDTATVTEDMFKITHIDAQTGLSQEIVPTSYTNATGALVFDGITVTFDGTDSSGFDATLKSGDKLLIKEQDAITGVAGALVTADDLSLGIATINLSEFSIHNVQLDAGGNVVRSTINLSLNDNTAGTISFNTPQSKVATLDTKLKDISLFTNADGRMVLDNTQEIQIVGNNKSVKIYMEGNDTIEDFRSKLNQALIDLGMGTGDETIDQNLVRYVTEEEAQASGNLAVAGTFVFQGAIAGDMSKIDFIGDQGVLDALSLATIQSGENSDLKITVTDAHNGKVIGSDTVSDGVLRGVIENIDVKVNNPQLTTSYNSTTGKMTFTSPVNAVRMQLHVADNRTEVQIGANEGQKFDTSIAQMDTTALEIDDALVNTMENSQKAITKFDQALSKVNGARATLGAQINRLEYTMQNLTVSRQNLIASESRIRDLDVAEETANFASKQVLVNAAVAMLAQANQLPQTALQLLRG